MPPILVDCNMHVAAPAELRHKYPLDPIPGTESTWTEGFVTTPEDLIKVMDEAGVHQAVVIAQMYHGFDSGYCADSVAQYPGRFVGVANVNVLTPDAADKVSYWIEERGLHGVRLWPGSRDPATWVDDPKYFPVWERVRKLGVSSNAHTTTPAALPNTRRFLHHFSDIPFIISALARIAPDEGPKSQGAMDLLSLAEFPRVHVHLPLDFFHQAEAEGPARDLLMALLEKFGPRRLMWVSFYPGAPTRPHRDKVETIRRVLAFLPEEDQAWILGRAARELYPSLKAALPDG